ncbi:MAG: zf-HC2 domain-containing protein [Candidatus Aminicenantes bacterium]|nr:MAG: zf-HC2 domain-containing protein [Candidatus Aminicenantes bacterium]
MNCRKVEKKIILSFSNDLDPHQQQALEAHLRDCPSCSRKYAEIKKDLKWLAGLPGRRPDFDWNRSWNVIRTRLKRNTWAPERRILQVRRILQAAAALVIFLLGIMIGRHILLPPRTERSLQTHEHDVTSLLIRQHLEEASTVLLEYKNRGSLAADQQILILEKQKARFLLFQNRNLQAFMRESVDPSVTELLNDLEILLYETANFEAGKSETHAFIKTLIRDKEIFFRIRHIGLFQASKTDKEVKL